MQAMHDFIVEYDKTFSDSIVTDSGFEIYLDKRLSARETASTIAKVVNTPALSETKIKAGDMVVVDPTILFEQTYTIGGKLHSEDLVEVDENFYRVQPSLIIAYKSGDDDWKSYGKNILALPIKKNQISNGIILEQKSSKYHQDKVEYAIHSDMLSESGAKIGDVLAIKKGDYIDFKVNKKLYWWINERDVLGVYVG